MKKTLGALLSLAWTLAFIWPSVRGASEQAISGPRVQAPADLASFENDLRVRVAKGEFPSFEIGVIRGGKVIWAESFGWADKEARLAATPRTAYGLASLGKSITAAAIMTLVDQGRLKLDDQVAKIIRPDPLTVYEGPTDGPNVRQLLDMTSGIPHGAVTYTDPVAAANISEAEILRRHAIVVFPPGQVFHYSNFSIALADRVIEKISRSSFGDYLSRAVFKPLGMQQSFVGTKAEGDPSVAARYDDDGSRIGPCDRFPRSSRGMNASLNDLLAYAFFHLRQPQPGQERILSDAGLETMQNTRSGVPGNTMALGLGGVDLPRGPRWLLANGRDQGAQSTLSMVPSAGVAVVCLTNVTGDQTDDLAIRITDRLLPGFASQVTEAMKAYEAKIVAFKPSGDWLGEWEGVMKTSAGDLPVSMEFESDGDVKISVKDQYPTLLDEPHFGYGLLSGSFLAKIPLEEAPAHYRSTELGLRLGDNRLYGYAFVNFTNARGHFELPTYLSLKRKAAK